MNSIVQTKVSQVKKLMDINFYVRVADITCKSALLFVRLLLCSCGAVPTGNTVLNVGMCEERFEPNSAASFVAFRVQGKDNS